MATSSVAIFLRPGIQLGKVIAGMAIQDPAGLAPALAEG